MKEEIKEGYKKTEIGVIPEDWVVNRLENITNLIKDGTHNPPKRVETGIPMLSAENIFNNKINFGLNEKCISISDYKEIHKNYEIESNDVLMTIVGTLGRTAVVPSNHIKFTVQRSVAILKPNEILITPRYLNYSLKSEYLQKQIYKRSNITAQAGIYLGEIKNIKIPLPPLKEQQKIASILSTVDEHIEQTDKLIEKTKELKKGLMQKLLTKGIGHTEFKKTEIGVIPKEWEVKRLGEIAEIVSGGTPNTRKKEYWNNGNICWATPTDITSNGKYITSTEKKITKEGLKNSSAKLLPIGSVLMTSRATIGESCINKVPMATNQGFKSFICKNELYNEFLYYLIDIIKRKLIILASGSTFLEISKSETEFYKISLPPLIEQKKIASILSEVDNKIEQYELKKEKLQTLKKGLMQQLLTGKIRVKVYN